MKILLLWQYYPPESVGFALAVRGMALAKFLKKGGHEVAVYAPFHAGLRSGRGESGELVQRLVTFESLRDFLPAALAILLFPAALLALAAEARRFRPDVLIVSQPSYTLPVQGFLVARLAGARFVADIQDIFLQDQIFARGSPWRRPKLLLERFVATHADFAFVVLPKMRDELLRSHGMRPERTEILYNGIDSERFPERNVDSEKTIDLLHIGSPRAYYDTLRLIDAFAMLCRRRPQTRLVFTDCRDEPYVASVRARVQQLGLQENVEFLGQLSRAELLATMTTSRIGIYTLYPDETSKVIVGTKVFEYLAMGLPVAHLGHPSGSVGDILSQWNVGILAYEKEDFAAQVSDVLDDPGRLATLSANTERAAKNYDWRVTVPRAFEVCLRVLRIARRHGTRALGGAES